MRALLLAALLASAASAQVDALFGIQSGTLVRLDTATRTMSTIGATGWGRVGGLAMANDGTLYQLSDQGELIRLDAATGAGTKIGDLGQPVSFNSGLANDPTTDRLYCIGSGGVGAASLVLEIDKSSGAATPIVDTSARTIVGLAFDSTGTLWAIDGDSSREELLTIDLVTGATFVPTPGGLSSYGSVGALAIGTSGALYAVTGISVTGTGMKLLCIDPTVGTATVLGGVTSSSIGATLTGLVGTVPSKSMVGTPAQVSVSAGGAQVLSMSVGPSEAGKSYQVLGTASGTVPGLVYSGTSIPLNPDAYLIFSLLNPNSPILNGSGGTLNSLGQATTIFSLPPGGDPALVGLTADHAGLVIEIVGPNLVVTRATNAEPCLLAP